MKKVFSGIQSSGKLSIGNYLGALKNHVALQESANAIYCVVDLHAITVRQEPEALQENSYGIAAWYLACGLDPKKALLFMQSHVPEHAQLAWLLNTYTQMGELERMTQFKDKSKRHKNNINAGLFTYPCLMAADILLYQTEEVPVGHDQTQHVELTRNIAARFNNHYGDTFTMPKVVIPKAGARVKDLQEPTKKMSKSDAGGGTIFLTDTMKEVEKKLKRAVTDNEARIAYDEDAQPGVANLLGMYAANEGISIDAAVKHFDGMQYGALKGAVADSLIATLEPMQKAYFDVLGDKAELNRILADGAQRARKRAAPTLEDVMKKIGFVMPVSGGAA